MIHTNKFSLERAKKGEPFTYHGAESKFGCFCPDGRRFSIWYRPDGDFEWLSLWFRVDGYDWTPLSMAPKKLEIKIWRNRVTGIHDATTEDIADHLLRTADPNWELLKTKSEEI